MMPYETTEAKETCEGLSEGFETEFWALEIEKKRLEMAITPMTRCCFVWRAWESNKEVLVDFVSPW